MKTTPQNFSGLKQQISRPMEAIQVQAVGLQVLGVCSTSVYSGLQAEGQNSSHSHGKGGKGQRSTRSLEAWPQNGLLLLPSHSNVQSKLHRQAQTQRIGNYTPPTIRLRQGIDSGRDDKEGPTDPHSFLFSSSIKEPQFSIVLSTKWAHSNPCPYLPHGSIARIQHNHNKEITCFAVISKLHEVMCTLANMTISQHKSKRLGRLVDQMTATF